MIRTRRELAIGTLIFVATGFAVSAYAQDEDEEVLDVVTVTGGKDEVRKLAGSATYIDENEIKQFDDTDIADLLTRSPGVYIRYEDGYGLRPNLGIRGAAAERSQKISIMEDGILIAPAPYSAPAAYYLPNVNRMVAAEVIKGPSSIAYGPHTVGGALNLVTSSLPNSRGGEIEASLGSDNYQKFRAVYGDRIGHFSFNVDLLHYGADGFKELDSGGPSGFERNDFNVQLGWQSASDAAVQQQLRLKLGYADEDSDETYLGLTDADFALTPDRRYVSSELDRFVSEHSQAHLIYALDFSGGLEVAVKAYANQFERSWNKFDGIIGGPDPSLVLARPDIFPVELMLLRGEIDSVSAGNQLIDVTNNEREFGSSGVELSGSYGMVLGNTTHELSAGFRFHQDFVERDHHQRGYAMVAGDLVFDGIEDRPKKALNEGTTDALAFYLDDRITLGSWSVDLGVRVEDISREFDNFLDASRTTNDETVVLPGLGVLWQWRSEFALLAGVHGGFSPAAPAAGSEVNSEESVNFEYGFRYNNGALLVELIGFFSDYSNLIGRCRVSDANCEPGEEFSAGDVQIAGAEFSSSWVHDFSFGWSLPVSVVYTYTESAFQSSFLSDFSQWGNVTQGDELPYLPEHTARLQAGLENDWLALSLGVKYVSEMREVAGQGALEPGLFTPETTIIDVSATWQVNDSWRVFAVAENIGDEREIVARRPIGARPTAPAIYRAGFAFAF